MFAYCNNNPVLYTDATGQLCVLAAITIGLVVGVASQFISGVVSNAIEGKTGADVLKGTGTVGEYVTAGLVGALCAIPGAPAIVSVVCDFAAPAVEQGIDYLVYGDTWSTGEYLQDVTTNFVCDFATTKLAFKSPEFIRDIADEAHQLGIKGKKNLLKYLEKAKDIAFYDGQVMGTAVSVSFNLGVEACKAIKRTIM